MTQLDGNLIASVKVESQYGAQFVISKLHHYKLGYKRLIVAYAQNNTLDPGQLRDMVVALFQVRFQTKYFFNYSHFV